MNIWFFYSICFCGYYIYINYPRTQITEHHVTSQRIPIYIYNAYYFVENITKKNIISTLCLLCACGDSSNCRTRTRLHVFDLQRTYLQSPCFGWVRKTSIFFAMFQHDWLGERSCRLNTCRFHLEIVSCNSRNDAENNRPNDRKINDRKISVMHTDELYGEQYYIS